MVNLMRKYQQSLMVFVTFIVIICFVWFYNSNSTRADRFDAEIAGKAYGRTVTGAEFKRMGRKFQICQMLGLNELAGGLGYVGNPRSRDEVAENFIWNSFVLRHEAEALGITPTDSEIIEAVQKLTPFSTSGVYDSSKYTQFVQNALAPNGFTTEQLEELVADSLRLEKIKALLGATDKAAPGEIRAMYERRNQKTEVSVIRLKLEDFKKEVKVTDEDVQKRFEEKKAALNHPEKRKVKAVAFMLPKTEKPLERKDRMVALQKLADATNDFAVAMTAKDAKLEEVAAKAVAPLVETPEPNASTPPKPGLPIVETPEFELSAPPKEIDGSAAVAEAAFKLTTAEPNSDAIKSDSENGYFVIQLTGITPSKPMTLEDAKKQLTDEITDERANEALNLKAAEIRKKITEATAAGKSFADAAKDAGAVAETFPAFSSAEPKMDQPDAREIMGRSTEMSEGELSDFTPTQNGGLLIHIDKRQPVDEAGFEKEKTMIASNLDRMKKEAAFQQWLKSRRTAAGFVEAKG